MVLPTLMIMVFLSLCSGCVAAIKQEKKPNIQTIGCDSLFQFMLLNAVRCILLLGDVIVPYDEDITLLGADIILIIVGCIGMSKCEIGKRIKSLYLTLTVSVYIVVGIYEYMLYQHLPSAVYRVLEPQMVTSILGGMFIVLFLLCARKEKRWRDRQLPWGMMIFVIGAWVMTVCIYPAFETYMTNWQEFSFNGEDVTGILLLYASGVFVALLLCCIMAGRWQTLLTVMLFAHTVCAYIQGMFLNGSLFLMDGKTEHWGNSVYGLNIVIWCALFGSICFLISRSAQTMKGLCSIVSFGLIMMQVAGGVSLLVSQSGEETSAQQVKNDYFSYEGAYEAASEQNVFVFVLDTYDVDYLNAVLEQDPNFLEPLEGFVYFPDTVSQFSRTFPSIPYMLTDELYFYEKPYLEYCEEAFEKCEFWSELLDEGYKVYFYEQSEEYIGTTVRTNAANYVECAEKIGETISAVGVIRSIYQMNYYRTAPYILKKYYNYTSGTINEQVVSEVLWEQQPYMEDDTVLFQGIKKKGLSVNDTEKKAFRFFHLTGAHAPYTMDENGNKVKELGNTELAQYRGSMKLVYEYLAELQKLGLYEMSTIIITADHGENYVTENLEQNTNPILFIKPSGSGTGAELVYSDAYASQNDLLSTLAVQLGLEMNETWGLDLLHTDGADKDRIRAHYYAVVQNTIQTGTRTYLIQGSSLDFDNWEATDEYTEFLYY